MLVQAQQNNRMLVRTDHRAFLKKLPRQEGGRRGEGGSRDTAATTQLSNNPGRCKHGPNNQLLARTGRRVYKRSRFSTTEGQTQEFKQKYKGRRAVRLLGDHVSGSKKKRGYLSYLELSAVLAWEPCSKLAMARQEHILSKVAGATRHL